MEKENPFILMETSILGAGLTMKETDMENISFLVGIYMMEDGKMINVTDLEYLIILMAQRKKDNGRMESLRMRVFNSACLIFNTKDLFY